VFWRKVLSEVERERLVGNIVSTLRFARKDIQGRLIDIYTKVDKDFGRRVAESLMKHSAKLCCVSSSIADNAIAMLHVCSSATTLSTRMSYWSCLGVAT